MRAKYDNFREMDQSASKEVNEKNKKLFKDIKDRLRKTETVGSNSMTVIKNLDDKYTKVNGTFKQEIAAMQHKLMNSGPS